MRLWPYRPDARTFALPISCNWWTSLRDTSKRRLRHAGAGATPICKLNYVMYVKTILSDQRPRRGRHGRTRPIGVAVFARLTPILSALFLMIHRYARGPAPTMPL